MSNKEEKRVVLLPDYLEGHEDHVIHAWRRWESLGYKIDNYPNRFQVAVNPATGATRTFDCKTPIYMMRKSLGNFGIPEDSDEYKSIMKTTKELQMLKTEKGRVNTQWAKYVFGKKTGDKSILGVKSTEVLDLFGKFYSINEVRSIIINEWKFNVKFESLRDFYNENVDKIEKKRTEYILRSKEVRLATDAGRLEVLAKLAWEMEQKFDKSKSLDVSKELRAVVEQIRKEVKGEEIKLTIDGKIDINATIQANQTLNEILSKLPINMIVVGLTAAKQGLNPAQLMGSLCNSYYSKFSGFSNILDKSEIQLPGKYIRGYDWEEMKKKNEQFIQDVEPITDYEQKVTEPEKVEVQDRKAKLLDMIKQMKEQSKDVMI